MYPTIHDALDDVPSAVALVPFFQVITRTAGAKVARVDLSLLSSRRLAR